MVAQFNERAHGQTTAEAVTEELRKETDVVIGDTEEDKTEFEPLNLSRAFRRMRTDWDSPDRDIIDKVQFEVDKQINTRFEEAFRIMYEIYDTVRESEEEPDADGLYPWKKGPDGGYIEDWTKMGARQRERFQYIIITRMFEWELTAAEIWGEAIFAKTQWEEAFATGFESQVDPKATIPQRQQRGTRVSAEYRYLAVFKAVYSKKADAVVRSMVVLSQRLKDLHIN